MDRQTESLKMQPDSAYQYYRKAFTSFIVIGSLKKKV